MTGIISAMQEEMQALLETLKDVTKTTKGMRSYYQGTLYSKEVVLVFSRWGKVAAAATTTQLINDYEITEIIFTGVAGAIQPQLKIGDIVIGKHLYQHDLDARPFYKLFEVPILKELYFKTKKSDQLIEASNQFCNQFSQFINRIDAHDFSITMPSVLLGDIASGDAFISNKTKINELNNSLPSVTCVEMEGASVAQVCYEYQIPFSIIRIISDKANDNAHIDFARFMDKIASRYSLGILKNYFA